MRRKQTGILVLAGLLLLGVAAGRQFALARQRAGDGAHAVESIDTPPLVTFTTVVLGGFRGLIADALWLRASRLQDEGRYFELVQLASWITALEPHSIETWGFHAWNMAYNVTAMMSSPEERWRWVMNGMRLMRDEGLRMNPNSPRLHFELGWLFEHKLGMTADPAHLYYQRRWAAAMDRALAGWDPAATPAPPAVSTTLRETYRMDAGLMREIVARYGPVDWRLPEAHALYWAYRGIQRGVGRDTRLCRRLLYQALARLFFSGHLEMKEATGAYERSPQVELLPDALDAFREALREDPSVHDAYFYFLTEAEKVLTRDGHTEEASRVAAILATLPPPSQ